MSEVINKRCRRCGEIKPAEGFHRDKLRDDGLNTECKMCVNAYWRRIRAIRKTQPPGPPRGGLLALLKEKRCIKCGETKPVGEFPRDSGHRGGWGRMCKICHTAYFRNRQRKQLAKIAKGSDALAEMLPPIPTHPPVPGTYVEREIDERAPVNEGGE